MVCLLPFLFSLPCLYPGAQLGYNRNNIFLISNIACSVYPWQSQEKMMDFSKY